jgi:hypothetical protein
MPGGGEILEMCAVRFPVMSRLHVKFCSRDSNNSSTCRSGVVVLTLRRRYWVYNRIRIGLAKPHPTLDSNAAPGLARPQGNLIGDAVFAPGLRSAQLVLGFWE